MKNLFVELKRELLYQWFSKLILFIFCTLTVLVVINVFSLQSSIKSKYSLYNKTTQQYIADGIDIETALSENYNIEVKDNIEEIDNILRYDYDNLIFSIAQVNPKNTINTILSFISFIFIPLIFGIYGVILGNYDYKYKTLKLRNILSDCTNYLLSKQIIILIISVSSIIFAIGISFIFNTILYKSILINPLITKFITNEAIVPVTQSLLQIIFAIIISIIFANIGFILSLLTKKLLLSSLIIVFYNLIIPPLGIYDLKNLIITIGNNLFKFNFSFTLTSATTTTLFPYLIYIALFFIIIFFSYKVFSKKSKYIC